MSKLHDICGAVRCMNLLLSCLHHIRASVHTPKSAIIDAEDSNIDLLGPFMVENDDVDIVRMCKSTY